MDVVACATAACLILLSTRGVLSKRLCFLWNRGVVNMPALFRELCLLDGDSIALVASSSSSAVVGAGPLTVIELRVSSLS